MAVTMALAAIAERLARAAHKGQVDKQGVDYIEHPARVAAAVEGDVAQAVAWLHDVVEDTGTSYGELIEAGLPRTVVWRVAALTRVHTQSYEQFIESIAKTFDAITIAVKLADLRDNLRPGGPPHLVPRYRAAIEKLDAALAHVRDGAPRPVEL